MTNPWFLPKDFMQTATVLTYPNWTPGSAIDIDIVPAGTMQPQMREAPYESMSPATHYGFADALGAIPPHDSWDSYKLMQGSRRFKIIQVKDFDGFYVLVLEEEKGG
jgi:hypothetical protein